MNVLAFYRIAYVIIGAFLGAVAGYLVARYGVMFFGVLLHLNFPQRYRFEDVVKVSTNARVWLGPLAAIACAAWAARRCYRFGRVPAHPR